MMNIPGDVFRRATANLSSTVSSTVSSVTSAVPRKRKEASDRSSAREYILSGAKEKLTLNIKV
jgi:hypothetical protein